MPRHVCWFAFLFILGSIIPSFAGALTYRDLSALPERNFSQGPLVEDRKGNFFGILDEKAPTTKDGALFKVGSDGIAQILHRFRQSDGFTPISLIAGPDVKDV